MRLVLLLVYTIRSSAERHSTQLVYSNPQLLEANICSSTFYSSTLHDGYAVDIDNNNPCDKYPRDRIFMRFQTAHLNAYSIGSGARMVASDSYGKKEGFSVVRLRIVSSQVE